tara:strand:+ start:280 stop:474 length:195 start_codon:yes stop_codon:yes gene_type:complete
MEDILSYIVIVVSLVVIVAYLFYGKKKSSPTAKPIASSNAQLNSPRFNVEKMEHRIRQRLKQNY